MVSLRHPGPCSTLRPLHRRRYLPESVHPPSRRPKTPVVRFPGCSRGPERARRTRWIRTPRRVCTRRTGCPNAPHRPLLPNTRPRCTQTSDQSNTCHGNASSRGPVVAAIEHGCARNVRNEHFAFIAALVAGRPDAQQHEIFGKHGFMPQLPRFRGQLSRDIYLRFPRYLLASGAKSVRGVVNPILFSRNYRLPQYLLTKGVPARFFCAMLAKSGC